MRKTGSRVSAKSFPLSSTTVLAALLALTLFLILPNSARAQSDAIRVMAGQVLADANRDGGIWRGDDRRDDGRYENRRVYDRRDAKEIRKQQKAREQFCKKNPSERVCREWFGYGNGVDNRRGNNGAWCWDRNRDGRCDVDYGNRRVPGRGLALGRR
jgi:hypothetical protein